MPPIDTLTTPEGDGPDTAPSRRKVLAASLFTAGYAVVMSPPADSAVTTDAEGLLIEEPKIAGIAGYALPAYVARPADAGHKRAAIIVANEIFGIHAYIKDICRRLAKLGYVAIAPAYFDRGGDPSTATDMAQIMPIVAKAGQPQVLGDTAGAVAWLQAQSFVDADKIGITGFCWGGNVVWMAAARVKGIKAGVAWYGRLAPPPPATPAAGAPQTPAPDPMPLQVVQEIKIPVLGLYGEKDQGIPVKDVEAMRAALVAAGNRHCELIVYPGAQHGFHADYRPSYNEAAAIDGWRRLQAWFKQHGVS
jgi:carboxymethylenebutenolidase